MHRYKMHAFARHLSVQQKALPRCVTVPQVSEWGSTYEHEYTTHTTALLGTSGSAHACLKQARDLPYAPVITPSDSLSRMRLKPKSPSLQTKPRGSSKVEVERRRMLPPFRSPCKMPRLPQHTFYRSRDGWQLLHSGDFAALPHVPLKLTRSGHVPVQEVHSSSHVDEAATNADLEGTQCINLISAQRRCRVASCHTLSLSFRGEREAASPCLAFHP